MKRFFCILAVFVVFLSSFLMPISADYIGSGEVDSSYRPVCNVQYVTLLFADSDSRAVFELPVSYVKGSEIFIKSTVSDTYQGDSLSRTIECVTDIVQIDNVNYIKLIISFDVVRYLVFSIGSSTFNTMPNGDIIYPYIDFINGSISSVSGNVHYIRPYFTESSYAYRNQSYSISSYPIVSTSSFYDRYYFGSFPYTNDIESSFLRQGNYAVTTPLISHSSVTVSASSSGDFIQCILYLPAVRYNSQDLESFSSAEWFKNMTSPYLRLPDFDFSTWVMTALGGFLSFEFAPGVSIGILVTFMIGLAVTMVLLKFFAGG